MQETSKHNNNVEKGFNNSLQQKCFVVTDLVQLDNLKNDFELCIIQTEIKNNDIDCIKKYKDSHKDMEFWISTNKQSKDDALIANKIGIKTIISSPVNQKLVEDFFCKKDQNNTNLKNNKKAIDASTILNAKVMIVDDNPMNVQLLVEILSDLGLDITTHLKPKEAYKVALEEKFDLFLLDIMMPEMSGFELAKKIKNSSVNTNVPFVFISALSDSYSKIKGFDLGSIAYIEKPFDINVVKSQIVNILKSKKTQETIISEQETFLATVAHDLKTPISAEINALNMLINHYFGEVDDAQKEILLEILDSTKYMKNIVENIVYKNKIDNDSMDLSKQICPFDETIKKCIDLTKYLLSPKHQKIVFKCSVDDTLIPFDNIEIQRAVNNLIANASEYSPLGADIVIELFKSHQRLGCSVQDFGKGIPLDEQQNVFSQFVSYAKKHKKLGTGLGLYITKNIIEKHNGEIFLESKVDLGTKITFFLPIYVKE